MQNKKPFHLGASKQIFRNAKALRREMTDAEQMLWQKLKDRRFARFKFRRQHPIFGFIADFYCHEKKLIVEVDGEIHLDSAVQLRDENRTATLEELGIRVMRLTNREVIESPDIALHKIFKALMD